MTEQAQDISSRAFSSITYDDQTELAVVIFHDGSRFTYKVPQDVMTAWVNAGSAGAFYNRNIRGQFAFFVD